MIPSLKAPSTFSLKSSASFFVMLKSSVIVFSATFALSTSAAIVSPVTSKREDISDNTFVSPSSVYFFTLCLYSTDRDSALMVPASISAPFSFPTAIKSATI